MNKAPSRQELVNMVVLIRDAKDRGQKHDEMITRLQSHVAHPRVADLLDFDYPPEMIVDYALGWRADWPRLSRLDMIALIRRIIDANGPEAEIKLMVDNFNSNCKHAAKSDLIYYPESHFDGNTDPSVEQIAAKAMNPLE